MVGGGHNVVSTVFIECGQMFKTDGPEHLRPVGETEFVNGVAAMSASGGYGATRACAGIVAYADTSNAQYAISGRGKTADLPITLTSGQ